MTRKHVKVEPDRWYYWCDKLGLLVWQDMPSGDKSISPDRSRHRPLARIRPRQYDAELKAMIDGLQAHPSIITWVVFNEGWGQFDTKRVADWTKKYDPTRLVDAASGWADRAGVGDVHDLHSYPRPSAPPLEEGGPGSSASSAASRSGSTATPGPVKIWGYAGTSSTAELTRKYERLLREGWDRKGDQGLNALVYTQITDVETEANGLLTYDRAVIKVDLARAAAVNKGDISGIPVAKSVVPTSAKRRRDLALHHRDALRGHGSPPTSTTRPGRKAPGSSAPGIRPGPTSGPTWDTPDVWARRTIDLPEVNPANLLLNVLHDEDAEIYPQRRPRRDRQGTTSAAYEELPISLPRPGLPSSPARTSSPSTATRPAGASRSTPA